MSREEHKEEDFEEEVKNPLCLHPRIFEGKWHESMPTGFDAVTIHLDGRVQFDLDWKKGREQAQFAVEKGYALMWNMQMGLFNDLIHPLTHQSQFLSLTLALEHFRDSLWKEFKSQTLGLILFRGSVDFSNGFRWDEHQEQNLRHWLQEINLPHLASLDVSQLMQHGEGKQFIRLYCRDVAIEYIALLATRLPDSLSAYLFLDTQVLSRSLLSEMQILNPERFDRLHLALRGHQLPFNAIGWEEPTAQGFSGYSLVDLPAVQTASIGICIPPMHFYHPQHYQGLEEGILALQKESIAFKLIAESHLTAQWDGLDYLLYSPTGLSTQGKRKLQGFCAAGGTVISTGNLLGLPNELGLKNWLEYLRKESKI
jgi:hypothetical protein